MNKLMKAVMLLLCLSIGLSSCTAKDDTDSQNSIIGTWRSNSIEYLGEFGNSEGIEGTGEFYVKFSESQAELYLDDMPNDVNVILTDYTFKDGDDSIIYFPKAYSEYEQRIVAQILNGELVIQQTANDWDWGLRYYFSKR